MENKGRVIVIDLFGESEETAVKADKTRDHECRCGVCDCSKKDEPEHTGLQLELQLRSYELPAPGAKSSAVFVPSGPVPEPRRGARKPSIH